MGERKPQTLKEFRGRSLPEPGALAGWAWLIERHDLPVPLPRRLAAVTRRSRRSETPDWLLLTPQHAPRPTSAEHLELALKWEGVDLAVLHALFERWPARELAKAVRAKPTGIHSRRAWFLYEWLTGRTLDLPDAGKVRAVPALDPEQHFCLARGSRSARHAVTDNLPGSRAFCPLVRRSAELDALAARRLGDEARRILRATHPDLVARAAAFLRLSDSRSSFAIEGEQPSPQRAQRWGLAIAEAGLRPLSLEELERLQVLVIGDSRFVKLGLRREGGFVGTHDRRTREPIPEHVSAKPEDLRSLVDGLVQFERRCLGDAIDPVVMGAALAFGFVYVHPFVDGNGRLHRWLIHHALAKAGFNPPGLVFPVSAVILREMAAYRQVLQSYSAPLLERIEWKATPKGNVEVLSETAPFYRYFDATSHAEFLYRCVAQTVEKDLPEEVRYLESFDAFSTRLQEIVEMPRTTIELLHQFLSQGGGRLSKRARAKEFAKLEASEVAAIERLYAACHRR